MAIPNKAWRPRSDSPRLNLVHFSGKALTEGIEEHKIAGTALRVYNPAKTIADCFKYRNKIGLDIALEALRDYWRQRRGTVEDLLLYGRICRVANVMKPYIETLVE